MGHEVFGLHANDNADRLVAGWTSSSSKQQQQQQQQCIWLFFLSVGPYVGGVHPLWRDSHSKSRPQHWGSRTVLSLEGSGTADGASQRRLRRRDAGPAGANQAVRPRGHWTPARRPNWTSGSLQWSTVVFRFVLPFNKCLTNDKFRLNIFCYLIGDK